MKRCPQCNAKLFDDSVRCLDCGYVFPRKCEGCGRMVTETTEIRFKYYCNNCVIRFVEEFPEKIFPIIKNEYEATKASINLPAKTREVLYFGASDNSPIKLSNVIYKMMVWKSDDKLLFFPLPPSISELISVDYIATSVIPINKIEHFSIKGDVFRESKITGGGGGGVSLGGAILGGIIAGGVGAVIGSRKGVNEVHTELVTHDTRVTVLNYFDDDNERCTLLFDVNAHEIFNDLIPEKEYKIVSELKNTEIIKSQSVPDEKKKVTDLLRELATLKNEGIITEEEFNEKKKILLDKII